MPQELLDHAVLGAVYRYWEKKRAGRRMPARRDIDPIEMDRRLLPNLMLCGISAHGNVIRFRLVGTSLAKRWGFDPTGQLLSDLPRADYYDYLAMLIRRAYVEAAPVYGESFFLWGAKGRLDARHVLLPLCAGGTEPAIMLIGVGYSSDDVFPPQLRALNAKAHHLVEKRETVILAASEPFKSANIA